WERSFDGCRILEHRRGFQVRIDLIERLILCGEQREWRSSRGRSEVSESGVGGGAGGRRVDIEILLPETVVAKSVEHIAKRETVIEDARPRTQDRFAGLAGLAARSPRNSEARRYIRAVADVGLDLIAKTTAHGEVRLYAPIILREDAGVELVHTEERRTRVLGERRGSATGGEDLAHCVALLQRLLRVLVVLNRGRIGKCREVRIESAVETGRRERIDRRGEAVGAVVVGSGFAARSVLAEAAT